MWFGVTESMKDPIDSRKRYFCTWMIRIEVCHRQAELQFQDMSATLDSTTTPSTSSRTSNVYVQY
jgi:hypothetical protein